MRRTDGPWPVWEIIPGQLYQRGKLHGYSADVKSAGLKHYDISWAVALAPPTPDPHLADLIGYVHQPIPDGLLTPERVQLVAGLAREMASRIETGETVMTMCNAGRNRSGLLSALIICELAGIPGSAAIDIVRRERPNALANNHFEAHLLELL